MTLLLITAALTGCAPEAPVQRALTAAPDAARFGDFAHAHARLASNWLDGGMTCDVVAERLGSLFGYDCGAPGELSPADCEAHLADTCAGGSAPGRDGTYLGDFVLYVEALDGSVGDTCEGTAELVFDATSVPCVQGEAECAFYGDLSDALPNTYVAVIDGDRVGFDALYGGADMDIDGMVIVDDWNGSFTDGDSMDSALEGVFNFGGTDFSYTGGFDVSR